MRSVEMKGPDIGIGLWAAPEDRLVQVKANRYSAEEEIRS